MDIENELMGLGDRVIALLKKKSNQKPLSVSVKKRAEALYTLYTSDEKTRAYLDVCMTIFSRALIENKTDMYFDGMIKLNEIIFGRERGKHGT